MKKNSISLCMVFIILMLTACGSVPNNVIPSNEEKQVSQNNGDDNGEAASQVQEGTASAQPTEEPQAPSPSPEPIGTISRTIDQSDLTAFFADSRTNSENAPLSEPAPFKLTPVSEIGNDISSVEDWFEQNRLYLPMANGSLSESARQIHEEADIDYDRWQSVSAPVFFDDNYIYQWSTENIIIYDRETGQTKYVVQISSDHWSPMGNCACVKDGILYIGTIHNGYAMENSCYLIAYDIENDKLLWRSEDQTYNSMNFIIKDGIILCGYGFTAEPDYIYQISLDTGKVLSKTLVAKMPDLLVEKDGQLYVHTYSYDYVLAIGR